MQSLKAYRRAAKLSQSRLSRRSAVALKRIQLAEQGRLRLRDSEIIRIIRAVNEEPKRLAAEIALARTEEIWPSQPSWKWLLTEARA
jgi:predicted transcriptional regulator